MFYQIVNKTGNYERVDSSGAIPLWSTVTLFVITIIVNYFFYFSKKKINNFLFICVLLMITYGGGIKD
jgi:fatty-acid desaturase